jgi:hypothetical protein
MDKDDLADFVRWAKEAEERGPSPHFVTVTCERLAVAELERCAEHVEADDPDGYRLLDAVRCLHLSMVAIMTAALNGSAGIGAMPEKARAKAIHALNNGEFATGERVMSYSELLTAVQTQGAIEWGPALMLTPEEAEACVTLNSRRERIDHPKPSSFIEARSELRRICLVVAPIVPRLASCVGHHFDDQDHDRIAKAVARIESAAVRGGD